MFRYIAMSPSMAYAPRLQVPESHEEGESCVYVTADSWFCINQTETAGQQDHARLIRVYNTPKSHHCPLGLYF